ncbi:unnamed protein product, partial [Oppiella nova]
MDGPIDGSNGLVFGPTLSDEISPPIDPQSHHYCSTYICCSRSSPLIVDTERYERKAHEWPVGGQLQPLVVFIRQETRLESYRPLFRQPLWGPPQPYPYYSGPQMSGPYG